MEKAWSVKIPIWNTVASSKDKAEIHEFRAYQHTEEEAKLKGLLEATKIFPPGEGWLYDNDNITVREISHKEMEEILEQHRAKISEQSEKRINDALDELESKTGIRLKKPGEIK